MSARKDEAMRNVGLWTLACGLMLGGCGGEEAAASTPAEPVAATAPAGGGTGASRTGSARSRGDDFDPSLPEYQGDHSIPGDPVAGQAVYTANCAACHAANGQGNGGMTGADFVNDRRRLARNNETLVRSITEGINNSPAMPPHRDILTEQQILDALSYIRTTFGTPPPS